ncbi:GIY-YIG nuclease family protein [Psychroserpens sp. SPM9]|uniref:GIY-YIG nuclease family protein n=1 Tax=Psychroserpens sp. SPM9 TaxID=2975598 RepID=UPI0021A92590|nr:GIY-YIG nuclease family protein [Psychroserpens sp. SPM9]MDG5491533.1 GIY-YIG nuclease family protein [Psychroserpens sp. SPM9]
MCFTYILYSESIDRYYVGYTCDELEERLRKHNTNHKGYTGQTNDWRIVYKESYNSKSEAYARERFIKQKKSRHFIERLIADT